MNDAYSAFFNPRLSVFSDLIRVQKIRHRTPLRLATWVEIASINVGLSAS
jgi:hypothetical protein